jgi:hypothetical protein
MISSKQLAASWLPFTLGVATTALAFAIAGAMSRPEADYLAAPAALPTKPVIIEVAPVAPIAPPLAPTAAALVGGAPRIAPGDEPLAPAQSVPIAAPAVQAAPDLVLVTATPQAFNMQPVAVTSTAVLSPAEEAARTTAADEAMRQSTEALEQPAMPAHP